MIGNDIIDLSLAQKESNWQRKGFLDKIFTANEQLLISKAIDSGSMVWNLWSLKEAAYKIYNRQSQIRAYMPLQFECFDLKMIDGFIYGKVNYNIQVYYTKTTITSEFIHTIAVLNLNDFNKIRFLDSNIQIEKKNGIPSYRTFDNSILRPLSKSHHGRFESIVTLFD